MKAPTETQIKKVIQWLRDNKSKIPHYTGFGDDNWEGIEAQIEVLVERLDEDDVMNRMHFEDDDESRREDESLWSMHAGEMARYAAQWLAGDEKESPADGWNIAKK